MDFRGVTAVVGRPGTGKTALAMRIAHERLARGEAVLWISLNEDRDLFMEISRGLGYDLTKAEFWEAVLTSPESFWPHLDELALRLKPSLIVVDSVTPLVEGPEGRRYLFNSLYRTIKPLGSDVLLIAEADGPSFVEYIADNVIRMELELTEYAVPERRLCVVKARGMPGGYCKQFGIFGGAGLVLFDELKPPPRPYVEVKTGLAIEELLGGPFVGNTLILGPPGSGKTRVALRIAAAAAAKGYRVVFRSFEWEPWQIKEVMGDAPVEIMRVTATPPAYVAHIYEFHKLLKEKSPDLIISDGFDVEFAAYGRKAFQLNLLMLQMMKEAGVAFVGTMDKPHGLAGHVDNVLKIKIVDSARELHVVKSFRRPLREFCRLSQAFDCES